MTFHDGGLDTKIDEIKFNPFQKYIQKILIGIGKGIIYLLEWTKTRPKYQLGEKKNEIE